MMNPPMCIHLRAQAYPKHFSEILDKAIKRLEDTLLENEGSSLSHESLSILHEARSAKERVPPPYLLTSSQTPPAQQ